MTPIIKDIMNQIAYEQGVTNSSLNQSSKLLGKGGIKRFPFKEESIIEYPSLTPSTLIGRGFGLQGINNRTGLPEEPLNPQPAQVSSPELIQL